MPPLTGCQDYPPRPLFRPCRQITPAPYSSAALDREFVTPLACLFDRFDALALDTGTTKRAAASATGRPVSAAAPPGAPGAGPSGPVPPLGATPLAVPAHPSATAPPSAPRSPLGPARRVPAPPGGTRPSLLSARRAPAGGARVSFGTPTVHTYGPNTGGLGGGSATVTADAALAAADAALASGSEDEAEETPLPSTAGHTPYSLTGSRGRGSGRGAGATGVSPIGVPDFGSPGVQEVEDEATYSEAEVTAEEDEDEDTGVTVGGDEEDCHYSPGASDPASPSSVDGRNSSGFAFARRPEGGSGVGATPTRPGVGRPQQALARDAVTPTLFGAGRVLLAAPSVAASAVGGSTPAPLPSAVAAAAAVDGNKEAVGALPFAREFYGVGAAEERRWLVQELQRECCRAAHRVCALPCQRHCPVPTPAPKASLRKPARIPCELPRCGGAHEVLPQSQHRPGSNPPA
jgi:hypothetical protein